MGGMGGQIEPARLAGLLEYFTSQHISESQAQKTVIVTSIKQSECPESTLDLFDANGITPIKNIYLMGIYP